MTATVNQKIPAGYKITEIGVIPEDWNIVTYNEAFNFLRTASYSRDQLGTGETKYIHYGDIHTKCEHFVDLNQELPTIEDFKIKNYSLIEDGDLIVVDASEDYEGVCKSVEVKNANAIKAISGLHTFLLRDKDNYFIKGFRGYIRSNPLVKSSMDRLATGLKVYGVSKSNLKLIQIPQPPQKEQSAIATTLSDANALIIKLEKLVEKKKKIKQGTMQKLLTGKRRLPGFSKKWEFKKLDEIFSISAGRDLVKKSYSPINDSAHPYPIYSNSLEHNGLYGYTEIARHKANCITITARGTIGRANAREQKFDAIGRLLILEPIKELNCFFISEYLNNRVIFSIESTGVPQLTAPQASKYVVAYPEPKEQTAIAKVLSEMDSEIEKLKSQLSKYRNIKQGMMQKLLTGQIRLIKK